MISVNVSVKKTKKHCTCEEDYAQNLTIWACKCDNGCEFCGCVKDFTFIKSLFGDLVVTCNKVVDAPENIVIYLSNGISYWIIVAVLLSVAFTITCKQHC